MDASTIIFLHEYLADFFAGKNDPISPPGVKDLGSIESAAARPFATAGGKDAYPTIFLKAGRYSTASPAITRFTTATSERHC